MVIERIDSDSRPMLGLGGLVRASLPYLRPHWRGCLLALVTVTPPAVFATCYPLIIKGLIDDALPQHDAGAATTLILALLAMQAANMLGDATSWYVMGRTGARFLNDLRGSIYSHLHDLSADFFGRAQAGDLIARFTSDLDQVEDAVVWQLPIAVQQIAILVFGTALLFSLEWRLAALCLLVVPLIYTGQRFIGPRADHASYRRQTDAARVLTTVQESIAAHAVVRAFSLRDLLQARLHGDMQRLESSAARGSLLSGLRALTVDGSGQLLLVVALGFGALLALRGEMTTGALVGFAELLFSLVTTLQYLARMLPPLQNATGGMQRIQELLAEPPQVVDPPSRVSLPPFRERLAFEAVTFGYGADQPTLRAVDLVVPAGRSVAIVGPSGSGKSSLLNLMMRFYDPLGGRVAVDGRDLRSVTQDSWRRQVGWVAQESFLFDASIRDNIRIGRPDATDREVEDAARAAEIHDFVSSLPDGYDTIVGERGGRLSGGQRQRLAIARAVLRRPAILMLDEATSALDPPTEAAINATLRELGTERTVVSVTHRLASVVDADVIYVLDQGRVVERGTHEELVMVADSHYRRLWDRQSGFVVSANGQRAEVQPRRLRAIPIFAELTDEHLREIASRLVSETVPDGRAIVVEGDPGDRFYILVRGSADVTKRFGEDERVLAVLEDGDFFGEIALLADVPRTATVRARSACLLLSLVREQFDQLLAQNPALRAVFEATASARRRADASHLPTGAAGGPV